MRKTENKKLAYKPDLTKTVVIGGIPHKMVYNIINGEEIPISITPIKLGEN